MIQVSPRIHHRQPSQAGVRLKLLNLEDGDRLSLIYIIQLPMLRYKNIGNIFQDLFKGLDLDEPFLKDV